MKLTRRKVRWIIKQKDSGERSRIVAQVMDITPRRIQQIWKYYRDHNKEPVIGKNLGRPKRKRRAVPPAKERLVKASLSCKERRVNTCKYSRRRFNFSTGSSIPSSSKRAFSLTVVALPHVHSSKAESSSIRQSLAAGR